MHRIDVVTAVLVEPDDGGDGPVPNGHFQAGNPLTTQRATQFDYAWCNAMQGEIAGVIEGAGLTLAKGNHNQLRLAIVAMISGGGGGGGSGIGGYAGDPNGHVAGTQAGVGIGPSVIWDYTSKKFWVCITTGSSGTAVWYDTTTGFGAGGGGSASVPYGLATGTADAIDVTLNAPFGSLAVPALFEFKAAADNTGATTIDFGNGALALWGAGGAALQGGEIVTGGLYLVSYDGTRCRLIAGAGAQQIDKGLTSRQAVRRDQWSGSFGATGYRIEPDGEIVQWGYSATTVNAKIATYTMSLPITFPTEITGIKAIGVNSDAADNRDYHIDLVSKSLSQIVLAQNRTYNSGSSVPAQGIYWEVRGR